MASGGHGVVYTLAAMIELGAKKKRSACRFGMWTASQPRRTMGSVPSTKAEPRSLRISHVWRTARLSHQAR